MVNKDLEDLVRKESMPIAVVDDDCQLIEGLADGLRTDGYPVTSVYFNMEVLSTLDSEVISIPNRLMAIYDSEETFLFIPNYSIMRKQDKFFEIFKALQESMFRPMIAPTGRNYDNLAQRIDFTRALRIYSWTSNYLNALGGQKDPNSPHAEIRSHLAVVQKMLNEPTYAFEGVNKKHLQSALEQAYSVLRQNDQVFKNVKFCIEGMHIILYGTKIGRQGLQ
jgi:hypothetical protein